MIKNKYICKISISKKLVGVLVSENSEMLFLTKSVGRILNVTISLSKEKNIWAFAGNAIFTYGMCTIICSAFIAPRRNYNAEDLKVIVEAYENI